MYSVFIEMVSERRWFNTAVILEAVGCGIAVLDCNILKYVSSILLMAVKLDCIDTFFWYFSAHTVWQSPRSDLRPLLTPFCHIICAGEHITDASLHTDPDCVSVHPVDGED